MERFNHNLSHLFRQLGLNHSDEYIERFIATHKLSDNQKLSEANFLQPSQQEFIRESQEQDADWCSVIDQFDALLRK